MKSIFVWFSRRLTLGWADADSEIVVTQPKASPVKEKMWSHQSHPSLELLNIVVTD